MATVYKQKDATYEYLFRDSFRELSTLMGAKLKFEKQANHSNFQSGIPLEDYFRQEFSKFIPKAYTCDTGTIIDRESFSCGECDFIIYDNLKSPFIRHPSTEGGRRKFLFHESTYGIIEVKQKLTLGKMVKVKGQRKKEYKGGTLDDSMHKLFSYKQLDKEHVVNEFLGAEIPGTDKTEAITNTPFTYAFFYDCDLKSDDELTKILKEFHRINMEEPVEHRVNGIFVLDKFSITWAKEDDSGVSYVPSKSPKPKVLLAPTGEDTLQYLYAHIANLLRITQAGVPIFNRDYGGTNTIMKPRECIVHGDK